MADLEAEIEKLTAAIAGLESQRSSLGDAVVDPAIAALRAQLKQLKSGAGDAKADERKLVTVVFTDVSGFTALSEKLDPERVRELINACFDWLVPVVQKYDGFVAVDRDRFRSKRFCPGNRIRAASGRVAAGQRLVLEYARRGSVPRRRLECRPRHAAKGDSPAQRRRRG